MTKNRALAYAFICTSVFICTDAHAVGPTLDVGALKLYSNSAAPIASGDVGLWATGNNLFFRLTTGADITLTAPQLPSQTGQSGKFLTTNGSVASWAFPTQDQILPGFAITGFSTSAPSIREIGQTISSPVTFTASYASPAASASITDGTNTTNLTTPFTSGSLSFSYTKTTSNSTQTWTLTAIAATTKTASVSTIWESRIYYGIAVPGTLNSAFVNALPASGLAAGPGGSYAIGAGNNTGKAYFCIDSGITQPSSFKDGGGFLVPMDSAATVSVTNGFSVTHTYDCYISSNFLNAAFTLVIQ